MPFRSEGELMAHLDSIAIGTPHLERRRGEIFICYADPASLGRIDVPGKRIGRMVFSQKGDHRSNLTRHYLVRRLGVRPVFADAFEHAQRYTHPEKYYDPLELTEEQRRQAA